MKKQRLLLSMICSMFLVYWAWPYLSLAETNLEYLFVTSWLTLALLSLFGNVSSMFFIEKQTELIIKKQDNKSKEIHIYKRFH